MASDSPGNHGTARWRERLALGLGVMVAVGGTAYALYYAAIALHEGTVFGEQASAEATLDGERSVERNMPVYFVGSSTIARFPLPELFPGRPWVSLGAGNETAIQLSERMRSESLQVPAGVVLYAGSADHNFDQDLSAREIRGRVERVIEALRSHAPDPAQAEGSILIVLLEILPARAQSAAERAALIAINRELSDLAAEKGLRFVQTNRPPLIGANGDLAEAMSVDRNHLNDEGYRVLARWIVEDGGAVGARLR